MSDHLNRAELESLFSGEAPRSLFRRAVDHLIRGCAECRAVIGASAFEFLKGGPPISSDVYEFPVRKAIRSAERFSAALDRERAYAERELIAASDDGRPEGFVPPGDRSGLRGWARAEALLGRLESLRHGDPLRGLGIAQLAVAVANQIDPVLHPRGYVGDLLARAWGELGNFLRLTADLGAAEAAFHRAIAAWDSGTRDVVLLARISEHAGSLRIDQRDFSGALSLFEAAQSRYEAIDDRSAVGRALLKKGIAHSYQGQPVESLAYLVSALDSLDPQVDGRLIFIAIHNLTDVRIRLDRFEEAQRGLRATRPLYEHFAGEIDLLKRQGQEGKIAAGLGRLRRAETIFNKVRSEYETRELPFHWALTSLDLAAVWVRQRRYFEVRTLADELVGAFRSLGVRREALAALLLFQEAAVTERATLAVIQTVVTRVERASQSGD